MPISRPLLVALLGALLACVAFYALRGGSAHESASAPATPTHRADPVRRAAPEAARAHAPRPRTAQPSPGLPAPVARTYLHGRTVVIFFYAHGADDAATAASVGALRHRGGAAVYSAPIARLSDYRLITSALGVARAPSVVVARRGRPASLIEGYVDPETLAQEVADLR